MKAIVIYSLVLIYAITCCNYFGWDFHWTPRTDTEIIVDGLIAILFALGVTLHKV